MSNVDQRPDSKFGDPAASRQSDWPQTLVGAQAGELSALGRLLEPCRRYLLVSAREQLGAVLRAKGGESDVVQETFAEAVRSFGRFNGTTEAELLAWLQGILRHRVSDFRRRFRQNGGRDVTREFALEGDDSATNLAPVDPQLTPQALASRGDEADLLNQFVDQLPANYQRVLRLRSAQGLEFTEIGPLLNTTADAARKLWARAVRRLRLLMDNCDARLDQ